MMSLFPGNSGSDVNAAAAPPSLEKREAGDSSERAAAPSAGAAGSSADARGLQRPLGGAAAPDSPAPQAVAPIPPHLAFWEESEAMSRLRFEAECEFVQALANPQYLRHLQKERYFVDPRFVAYLHYLDYWRRPPYVHHLLFPVCLGVLDLLQQREIRDRLEREDVVAVLDQTLRLHWLYAACEKNKV
ncbi:mediator complex subunit MED31 [Besnoitia besnoiti]|uniref:Mediator of RNA polymerase II transcription subunit 31 n=1 Tax=Besnoitia besnoiti TaxID=94643 RepID=A0A2A9MIE5_BESBE|nr:mediator complex subunit MED31 [Besnoitia besnoiti]PFH35170.1 mediator complex subunit MED31 [Besnoitia besnoiti]